MESMALDHSLRKKLVLNCTSMSVELLLKSKDTMHIAYGIDENFIHPMGVSMTSIVDNNPERNIVFHVMIENLPEFEKQKLKIFSQKHSTVIIIYFIDDRVFTKLPSTEHFTKATYNRFLLPKILNGIVDRVIYLDADILCLNRFDELVSLDFLDKIVAVVQDVDEVANRQIEALDLKDKHYFNAGFLYIDIKQWNEKKISELALQISYEKLGKLDWLDQDALNIALQGKCLFISQKYDYILDLGCKRSAHALKLPEDVALVHYTGRHKPWHQWCMHSLRCDFEKYSSISLWADVPLVQPRNYKDMKKMGQSYWYYRFIGKSFLWYMKYAYFKIKTKIFDT